MKLRQFEFLCMLSECGSISRVAEESYTSQPAVSISIKELETELGYPLLKRTNRGIQFTERGEQVLAQARIIMQALEQINHISEYSDGALRGTLHIGSLPHICNTLLFNVQAELQDKYPEFTLRLDSLEPPVLTKLLERGALDVAVVQECDFDHEEFRHKLKKLRFEPLFEDKLSFVVVKGHPLLEKAHVKIEDLRGYPFAAFGDGINRSVMILTQDMGYPERVSRFEEMIRMRKFMERYNGITVQPRRAVIHGNLNYRIKFVPLELDEIDWVTRVGWLHQQRDLAPAEEVVIEHLKKQCENPEFITLKL